MASPTLVATSRCAVEKSIVACERDWHPHDKDEGTPLTQSVTLGFLSHWSHHHFDAGHADDRSSSRAVFETALSFLSYFSLLFTFSFTRTQQEKEETDIQTTRTLVSLYYIPLTGTSLLLLLLVVWGLLCTYGTDVARSLKFDSDPRSSFRLKIDALRVPHPEKKMKNKKEMKKKRSNAL